MLELGADHSVGAEQDRIGLGIGSEAIVTRGMQAVEMLPSRKPIPNVIQVRWPVACPGSLLRAANKELLMGR